MAEEPSSKRSKTEANKMSDEILYEDEPVKPKQIGYIELEKDRDLTFFEDGRAMLCVKEPSCTVFLHFSASDVNMLKDWFLANGD